MSGASRLKVPIPHSALTAYIRELRNCVVLRNEEDLFGHLERGGDVDLLVDDLEVAERTLIRHLGCPIRIMNYSYARGYSFDWGHIDLVRTIEWRGACYLSTQAILEGRRLSAGGRHVPRMAHEASISWLTSLLWGAFFKERYASVIQQAVGVDGLGFRQVLMHIAGKKWGVRLWRAAAEGRPDASATWAHSVRSAVWWRACFRAPVRTIHRYFAFVIEELRRWCAPPVPWILILGVNDTATSSVAKDIVNHFAQCPYGPAKAFRWSPRVTVGGRPRRLVSAVDWMVAYWTQFARLRAKGYILVLNGTHMDVVINPKGEGRPRPALARALRQLFPQPDSVFVLDSEGDVVLRDGHLPVGYLLNGGLPRNVLLDDIQRVIREWMLVHSAASLGTVPVPMNVAPIGKA